MSQRPRAWHALAALGALAAAGVVVARRMADPDLPWHIAFGRRVLATGSVPRQDDFAFTRPAIRYAEVAADVGLAWLERAAGAFALQLALGLVVLGTAGLSYWRARRAGPVAVVVVGLALVAAGPWLLVRPATVSLLFLAGVLAALDVRRREGASRRGRIALGLLVPLHLLWANVHGFAVVGVALVVGYAAYASLARLLGPRASPWFRASDAVDLPFSLGAAGLTLGAACLNLAGPRLLLAPFEASRDFQRIGEWQRPTFELLFDFDPAALVLGLVVLAAFALGSDEDPRRPNLFDAGTLLLALLLSLSAVRLIAVGAVLAAPVVAERLGRHVRRVPVVELACGFATLLAAPVLAIDPGFHFGRGFDLAKYPEGAVRFIQDAKPSGRMWNHLPYGGWLVFRLYPDERVLVDGRTGWVHDPNLVSRVIRSESDPAELASLVHELGLDWAVSRATEGLPFGAALAASPEFRMLYLDENAAVYARRSSSNNRIDGYRMLTHQTSRRELLAVALSGGAPADALEHDARLAVAQAPGSARAAVWLACAALARRDEGEFAEAKRLLAAHPEVDLAELDLAWRTRAAR